MKSFGCSVIVFLIFLSACGADNKKGTEAQKGPNDSWYESGRISDVEASSFLLEKSDFLAYYPWKALDGDPLTAWNEGVKGPGIGEKLFITIGEASQHPVYFDRIEIMPGFFDARWYSKNNRIKQMLITDGDFSYTAAFDDGMNVKTVRFAKPIKSSGLLCLTIRDVYKGDAYDETCISEVSIFMGEVKFPLTDELTRKISLASANLVNVIKQFPEINFNSPSGMKFFKPGQMGYGTNEYFFSDGRYASEGTGFDEFTRSFGTWKMDPITNVIHIKVTKTGELVGVGKYECLTPCNNSYYAEYEYKEKEVSKSSKKKWFEYLYFDICMEHITGEPGVVKAISTVDDQMLPENWKQQAEIRIEKLKEEYNYIVEEHKKGRGLY